MIRQLEYKNKRSSNINNNIKEHKSDKKLSLSDLANITHEEIVKNKCLTHMIKLKNNQLKKSKLFLSKFSVQQNNPNKDKKQIEKELTENKQSLLELNKTLKNEIKNYQEEYKINCLILERNIEQERNILDTLKETNFLLENKIKEKECLIMRIRELLCNFILKMNDIELIKDIDQEYFGSLKEGEKIIEYVLFLNNEFHHEYLLYKSMKFNKEKNKILRLNEEKKNLLKIINDYINQKPKIKTKDEAKIKEKIINGFNNSNENNNNITNDTTENIIFNMNDSLYFDTEEQINVEFPENNFSGCYLSPTILGLNICKKKINVPPLDLKLIEYNKNFMMDSFEEKSLSRDFEEDIDQKVKVIKKQIKSLMNRNKNMEIKFEKYEKKIKQMNLFIHSKQKNKYLE
jgi:hypothetical protein